MNCKHNQSGRGPACNPWLRAGLLINAIYLVSRCFEPERYLGHWGHFLTGACAGGAIALILLGVLFQDPRQAERLRAWKRRHLPFLFH